MKQAKKREQKEASSTQKEKKVERTE